MPASQWQAARHTQWLSLPRPHSPQLPLGSLSLRPAVPSATDVFIWLKEQPSPSWVPQIPGRDLQQVWFGLLYKGETEAP